MSPNMPKATTLHPQILKMLGLPPEQPRDATSGVSVSETGVCGCVCAGVCGGRVQVCAGVCGRHVQVCAGVCVQVCVVGVCRCVQVCAGVCGGHVQVCAVGVYRCVQWACAGVCGGCVHVSVA